MNPNITINVPFTKRHILPELRINGGKFNPDTKPWILPDNPETSTLKELVERRIAAPSPAERIKNVLTLSVDFLNTLKIRQFKLTESGDRIVIESTPLAIKSTPSAVENASMMIS